MMTSDVIWGKDSPKAPAETDEPDIQTGVVSSVEDLDATSHQMSDVLSRIKNKGTIVGSLATPHTTALEHSIPVADGTGVPVTSKISDELRGVEADAATMDDSIQSIKSPQSDGSATHGFDSASLGSSEHLGSIVGGVPDGKLDGDTIDGSRVLEKAGALHVAVERPSG